MPPLSSMGAPMPEITMKARPRLLMLRHIWAHEGLGLGDVHGSRRRSELPGPLPLNNPPSTPPRLRAGPAPRSGR